MGLLSFLPLVGDALGAWAGSSAQHSANRTNIRLQREQQAWEERMSNTAVARHAADIERAGGNRALAFVNGQQASTPTVTPARVESTFDPKWTDLTSKAMAMAQIKNINADTIEKMATARTATVEADIREAGKRQETEMRINKHVEQREWDDIRTEILRTTASSSAHEERRLRETVDSVIQSARQQARAGKLDLDALENIAKVGGIEAGKTKDILKLIIDLLKD